LSFEFYWSTPRSGLDLRRQTHEKYLIKLLVTSINVVFQFYPWFIFYFPLFQTHYHTLPYPKTKESKIYTKDKIEPQHILMLVEPLKVIQRELVYFIPISLACEQALLAKRAARERASERQAARGPSLTRSREARFACPNRRACSQATIRFSPRPVGLMLVTLQT